MSQAYQIAVLGAGGVGKSSLVVRIVKDIFLGEYDPTIDDFYRKSCTVDDKYCTIEFIDISGSEEFAVIQDQFIQRGQGFLLVYAIDDRYSFEEIPKYRDEISRLKLEENIPVALVGNKCDLETERKISKNEALNLATQFQDIFFIETSAKNNINVEEAFFAVVRKIRLNSFAYDPNRRSKCCIL